MRLFSVALLLLVLSSCSSIDGLPNFRDWPSESKVTVGKLMVMDSKIIFRGTVYKNKDNGSFVAVVLEPMLCEFCADDSPYTTSDLLSATEGQRDWILAYIVPMRSPQQVGVSLYRRELYTWGRWKLLSYWQLVGHFNNPEEVMAHIEVLVKNYFRK